MTHIRSNHHLNRQHRTSRRFNPAQVPVRDRTLEARSLAGLFLPGLDSLAQSAQPLVEWLAQGTPSIPLNAGAKPLATAKPLTTVSTLHSFDPNLNLATIYDGSTSNTQRPSTQLAPKRAQTEADFVGVVAVYNPTTSVPGQTVFLTNGTFAGHSSSTPIGFVENNSDINVQLSTTNPDQYGTTKDTFHQADGYLNNTPSNSISLGDVESLEMARSTAGPKYFDLFVDANGPTTGDGQVHQDFDLYTYDYTTGLSGGQVAAPVSYNGSFSIQWAPPATNPSGKGPTDGTIGFNFVGDGISVALGGSSGGLSVSYHTLTGTQSFTDPNFVQTGGSYTFTFSASNVVETTNHVKFAWSNEISASLVQPGYYNNDSFNWSYNIGY